MHSNAESAPGTVSGKAEVNGAARRSADWQVPIHVSVAPQSVRPNNNETFGPGAGLPAGLGGAGPWDSLSMADISQQTRAIDAQLKQAMHGGDDGGVAAAGGRDRLPVPLRVNGTLSHSLEPASVPAPAPAGAPAASAATSQDDSSFKNHMPMHVVQQLPLYLEAATAQHHQANTNTVESGDLPTGSAADFDRLPSPGQAQQQQQVAQMMQLIQYAAAQQQAAQFQLQLQQQQQQQQAASPVGSGREEPFDRDKRIEELNQYIRQQAQEYLEGQAEWSRQIAEVRSEWSRELHKVRREKEEVDRQARQEMRWLQQRLREAGIEDFGDSSHHSAECSGSSRLAGISLEELQRMSEKLTASEDRIGELEQYIKDQSAKHLADGGANSKEMEDDIRTLQQVVITKGLELRHASSEYQALHVHQHQRVTFWEHGVRRLLGMIEEFMGRGDEELENSHFGRTATKLSLILPEGEGSDVSSLRHLLKDVLKNGCKAKSPKQGGPLKAKDGQGTAQCSEETRNVSSMAASQLGCAASASVASGEISTLSAAGPISPGAVGRSVDTRGGQQAGGVAADGVLAAGEQLKRVEDSNCSSPDRGSLEIICRPGGSAPSSTSGDAGTGEASGGAHSGTCSPNGAGPNAKAMLFLTNLAADLRQLVTSSQHQQANGTVPPPPTAGPSPIASPRYGGAAGLAGPEQARIQELLDSIAPARRAIAQNIMTVEKMLRGLERDLRHELEAPDRAEEEGCADADTTPREGLPGVGGPAAASQEERFASLASLRRAKECSSAALAEFVQLPQKLKTVFDVTKKLSSEISARRQASGPPGNAMLSGNFAPGLRVQAHIAPGSPALSTTQPAADSEEDKERDEQAAARESQAELERGVVYEEQLIATRSHLRRLNRKLADREERVRILEQEIVELQLSRHKEHAQCAALAQQQLSGHPPGPMPSWMWPWANTAGTGIGAATPGSTPKSGAPLEAPAGTETTGVGASAANPSGKHSEANGDPTPWRALYNEACSSRSSCSGSGGSPEWPAATCVA